MSTRTLHHRCLQSNVSAPRPTCTINTIVSFKGMKILSECNWYIMFHSTNLKRHAMVMAIVIA